jgi:hypothetical protein
LGYSPILPEIKIKTASGKIIIESDQITMDFLLYCLKSADHITLTHYIEKMILTMTYNNYTIPLILKKNNKKLDIDCSYAMRIYNNAVILYMWQARRWMEISHTFDAIWTDTSLTVSVTK